MKIPLLTLITIIMFLSSCSEAVIGYPKASIQLLEKDTTRISFNSLFDVIQTIPIKETDSCYIDGINKIEYFNSCYYILCSTGKSGLLVFDGTGNFLYRIGNYGKGHGEYLQPYSFAIDRKNNRILLLCSNSRLKIYRLNGDFVQEHVLSPTRLWNIECIEGKILCTSDHKTYTEGDDAKLFYFFDEKFNLIKKHTSVVPHYMSSPSFASSNLKCINDKFYYFDYYTHCIYLINKEGDIICQYDYNKSNLMDYKHFRNVEDFVQNQFKYDFIFDSFMMKNRIVSSYKSGREIRLSVNDNDGNSICDYPLGISSPKFFLTEGNTVTCIATAELLEKSDDVPKEKYNYYIVRYVMKNEK